MPAWVLGKLTPRWGLHCRDMLASILGVHPLAEARERGRIQGMYSHNKGLKWLLGELWGWGGPSGLSWFVGKKLGLSTFMLLLGDVALGRVLFVRPIQTGLKSGLSADSTPCSWGNTFPHPEGVLRGASLCPQQTCGDFPDRSKGPLAEKSGPVLGAGRPALQCGAMVRGVERLQGPCSATFRLLELNLIPKSSQFQHFQNGAN